MSHADDVRAVAAHYSRAAEEFARHAVPTLRPLGERLVARLPLREAGCVLDVGTGAGGLLPALRAAAPDALVIGTDLAEGMLRVARRGADVPLAAMDAAAFALADRCADAMVLAFVLHRVAEPLDALREAARVLRPGGHLGTATWAADNDDRPLARRVWDEEVPAPAVIPPGPPISRHDRVDTPEKMRALLTGAGFAAVEAWREVVAHRRSREEFLAHHVDYASRAALEGLSRDERAARLARVRARLADLEPDAFIDRSRVVYAVARR